MADDANDAHRRHARRKSRGKPRNADGGDREVCENELAEIEHGENECGEDGRGVKRGEPRDAVQAGALMASEARTLQRMLAAYCRVVAGRRFVDVPTDGALVIFTNLVRAIAGLRATLESPGVPDDPLPLVFLPGIVASADTAGPWLSNAVESLIDVLGLGVMRTTQALQLSFFPRERSDDKRLRERFAGGPDVGEVFCEAETYTFPTVPAIVSEEVAYAVELLAGVGEAASELAEVVAADEYEIPVRRLKDHWLVWCFYVAREELAVVSPQVQTIEPKWYFDTDPSADSRFQHGPVEGPISKLTKWMGQNDERTVKKHNGKAGYWIKRIHGRRYAAWFTSVGKYAQVNSKRLADVD